MLKSYTMICFFLSLAMILCPLFATNETNSVFSDEVTGDTDTVEIIENIDVSTVKVMSANSKNITEMNLNDYLLGVVAAEVNPTYHEEAIKKIFTKLYEKGDIYKSTYEGKYCVPCESFYTESQLIDCKCPDCGREVIDSKEEAYFLKLSKYQDKLLKYFEENPDFIKPESRKNEMINNFLKPGLSDLCVSRSSFS